MNKRTAHVSIYFICLIASFLILTVAQVTASNVSNSPSPETQKWETYKDDRFDFSFEYPANWYVVLRDDSDPEGLSGTLMLTPINPEQSLTKDEVRALHSDVPYIAVGLYLAELESKQSLNEWTELYQEASKSFNDSEIQARSLKSLRIGQVDAVQQAGVSPLTEYQFTNLAYGNTVWFIWTNISDLENNSNSLAYQQLVNSFRFGDNTPAKLSDIYGSGFQPLKLGKSSPETFSEQGSYNSWLFSGVKSLSGLQSTVLSSSWKSPVIGSYNVQCGSARHTGKAEYAADVGTPMNTSVYAAYSGNVFFAGWNNDGYGNLIKTSSVDGKTAYYAHLNTINTYNGANITTYQFIAKSGNSGPSNIHLHFHVNYTNLTGMSGFNPNGNYPTMTDISCGTMGR